MTRDKIEDIKAEEWEAYFRNYAGADYTDAELNEMEKYYADRYNSELNKIRRDVKCLN